MGKEEIARNEQFLLFPQCFLLNHRLVSTFVNISNITSLFAAELEEPKIGIWGKGLNMAGDYGPSSPSLHNNTNNSVSNTKYQITNT